MNLTKNIALVGAGQLGSRHLQSLSKVANLSIQVFDTSEDSLKTAKNRFEEVSKDFNGNISYHTNLGEIKNEIDIAIIATNSKVRRKIIEDILQISTIKNFILEKFLFVNKEDYSEISKLFLKKNIKAWVNCPRRLIDFYIKLKNEMQEPINFLVNGNSWGLGCNGIHFLDLFAFLIDSTKIDLSNVLIDRNTVESKRLGYIEFTGTIAGNSNENSFAINSNPLDPSPLVISISSNDVNYVIFEGSTSKVLKAKKINNWKWEEEFFDIPFQSQMTNVVVDSILQNGTCMLTSFEESSKLHLLFLDNLIDFLREIKSDNTIEECLIT